MAPRHGRTSRGYAAFISYRHVDADRRWARWLHRWLEGYRIPRALRKQRKLPARVGRVFRDEEELAASSDLSAEIQAALEASEHLVVVCSPHTPASQWVNQEISRFRELGRNDRILALLVDGEPRASFPRPLREIRHGVTAADSVSREEIEEVEPLAADVRPSTVDGTGRIRRMAGLKLAACILGVSFDELRRREHERRMRRMTVAAIALLLVTAAISTLAVIAVREGRRADERTALARDRLLTMYEEQGRQEWLDGRPLRAAPYLAAAYEGGRNGASLRLDLAEILRSLDARSATLLGHTHDLFDATFDPAGNRVLTASADGTARIWDARDGRELVRLTGHPGHVMRARFSPDGSRVATSCADGAVRLWNARTGELLASLEGIEGSVPHLDISPDGMTVVTTSSTDARIWNTADGSLARVLHGRGNPLRSARFDPDGTRVVAAAKGHVIVWDPASGEEVLRIESSFRGFRDARFSPDGRTILALEDAGDPRLWSAVDGRAVATLAGLERTPEFGSFSTDGRRVVTGGGLGHDAGVWLVEGDADVRLPGALLRHVDGLTSVRFSPDGRHVLTTGRDGTASLWDAASGLLALDLSGHTGAVWHASWSPDGSQIVTASADASAMVWNAARARDVRLLTPGPSTFLVCATRGGDPRLALSDAPFEETSLWELGGPRKLFVLPFVGGSTAGGMAAFDRSGRRLGAIIHHATVALVDTKTGQVTHDLRASGRIRVVAFDPTGERLATGHENGTCALWSTDGGERLWTATYHAGDVTCLAFSADGMRLATGSLDHTVRILDVETGGVQQELEGHRDWVRSVCFHPSKDWLVTGSTDRSVKVWDLGTGRMLTSMDGHDGEVLAVDVDAEGSLVVSAGTGSLVRIWDVTTGAQVDAFSVPGETVDDVWFGPGDEHIGILAGGRLTLRPIRLEERDPSTVGALVTALSPFELVEGRLVQRPAGARPYLPRISSDVR